MTIRTTSIVTNDFFLTRSRVCRIQLLPVVHLKATATAAPIASTSTISPPPCSSHMCVRRHSELQADDDADTTDHANAGHVADISSTSRLHLDYEMDCMKQHGSKMQGNATTLVMCTNPGNLKFPYKQRQLTIVADLAKVLESVTSKFTNLLYNNRPKKQPRERHKLSHRQPRCQKLHRTLDTYISYTVQKFDPKLIDFSLSNSNTSIPYFHKHFTSQCNRLCIDCNVQANTPFAFACIIRVNNQCDRCANRWDIRDCPFGSSITIMVVTLVHEHYQFIKEGFLPEPQVGHLVGILCPECSTPLCYFAAREDAWTIYCPQRPRNEHNWRTFRCDQFNHERALINAGAPRPIISSEKDWGPRISPSGVVLGQKPISTASKRAKTNNRSTNRLAELLNPIEPEVHPFLGRHQPIPPHDQPQLDSHAGPVRAKVKYPCLRASRGPVARNHRTTGNKGCPHQYCQSCCLEYGLGACLKHTRHSGNRPGPTLNRMEEPLPPCHPSQLATATASTLSAASTSTQPTPDVRRPGTANKYDEAKVITILLWLNADQPNVISAHFAQWPKAKLDESTLLMQACTQTLGPTWNRALCFWDDNIDSWVRAISFVLFAWLCSEGHTRSRCCQNETMVTFPHRYPTNVKVVVVRSPHVDPRTAGLPQPKARRIASAAVANTPQTSNANASSLRRTSPPPPPRTSPPPESDDEVEVVRSDWTDFADAKRGSSPGSDESDKIEVVKSNIVTEPGKRTVKRELSEELPDFDPFDESPLEQEGHCEPEPISGSTNTAQASGTSTSTNPAKALKRKWPGKPSLVLVSTLLAWYKQCETRPPLQAWQEVWGDEWVLVGSTVYRHRAWIAKVTYDRFYAHYRNNIRATVEDARRVYKKEFQEVVNGNSAATN
ncbi:uncharacterized protein MELLADRAFT_61633 [Melampsora larici-populina 98AG31]|uniref:Uncharacterized protein n=1 Tax=Melampsora larici-populina (strain 98AG31 / pathotype 3-4-7) TaxID=747676 RepID=F4RFP7_MELLP|nr:uncharacterized protein MELLADRAFT_61633 [Melampsora larici-populina 98AG31]EGG08895.1 hypothetical protein MELLADRAFT_61633 [Melampsora larici-populina 98AG31]